jgi:ribonuclease HI
VNQPSLFGAPGGADDPRPGGTATVYTDGGSRGNPGPGGYGVRIERDDGTVVELKEALGLCTNNVAEYRGLLAALRWAADHALTGLRVRSDSELLVKQMRGEYRVKHPALQRLHAEARTLVHRLGRVTFEHVRREQNREADRLANDAMDEAAALLREPDSPPRG